MTRWQLLVCGLLLVGVPAVLYGIHRLCLWLEAKGHLYYWHRRSDSSAAGSLVAMQQMIEPQAKHVHEIKDEKRRHSDEEAPGQGDSPAGTNEGPSTPGVNES